MSRKGFTLIELLVAIAIIGALAAILFPIFTRVREKGRQAACISNLRQLGIAVMQYAQDNEGFVPPYNTYQWPNLLPGPNPQPLFPDQSAQLVASLKPFTGSTDLWFCPSDPYSRIGGSPLPINEGYVNHRNTSYLFLGYSYRTDKPLRVINLLTIKDTGAHSELFIENAWGCWANEDSMDQSLYSHNGMFNAVMLDGHVVSYRWHDPNCFQMPTP